MEGPAFHWEMCILVEETWSARQEETLINRWESKGGLDSILPLELDLSSLFKQNRPQNIEETQRCQFIKYSNPI